MFVIRHRTPYDGIEFHKFHMTLGLSINHALENFRKLFPENVILGVYEERKDWI